MTCARRSQVPDVPNAGHRVQRLCSVLKQRARKAAVERDDARVAWNEKEPCIRAIGRPHGRGKVLHFSHQPKLADAQGRVCLTNPNARDDRIQNPAKFVVTS